MWLASSIVSKEDQILVICNGLHGDDDSIIATVQEGGASVQELTHKILTQEGRLERRNFGVHLLPIANENLAISKVNFGTPRISANLVN